MKKILYTCPRCGYETKRKPDIKNHLYERKKLCPGAVADIELTDVIKEKIILNRIYIEPKLVKETPKKNIMVVDDSGYVYIFYPRATKNSNECIYKIGKTDAYIRRAGNYMKGGDMKLVLSVKNRHDAENKIKQYFKIEFNQRRDYGIEFFEGDLFEMALLMKDILSEETNEIIIDYEI